MVYPVSAKELAEAIARDERTVRHLVHTAVLPRLKRGVYDLKACSRAFVEYLDRQAEEVVPTLARDPRYRKERIGLVRIHRERSELELALRKGELHRADDVEAVMNDVLTGIKMRFLAIPSRVARLLVGQTAIAKVIDILTQAIYEALGDSASYSPETFVGRNKAYLESVGINGEETA